MAGESSVDMDEIQKEAIEIYSTIIRTSNYFLHHCKRFSIQLLAEYNPSFMELAEIARKISKVLDVLADDFDPMLHQKAKEYCALMEEMAIAIVNRNDIRLSELVAELERKPGL